ncbi:YcaO-like family protein [Gracilibacillus caseinilyticus]|uniref:YcaO-like family protein n=1 Tax=Gracilibacillus caseinilyticus TaxID=2932256 RepID=A0ABY4EYN6_9BACI|nr:YcaO-like family protein [Gracilibacillus caseinilyticus]UOQ49506.1 YcaO-like family protein [Gracilibacillus caseinilyticus]
MNLNLLVDEDYGIIQKIEKQQNFKGEFPLHIYIASRNDVKNIKGEMLIPMVTNGSGFSLYSKDKAIKSAVGEAIERYCCAITENHKIIYKSDEELNSCKLLLETITRYEDWQYDEPYNIFDNVRSKKKLYWVEGFDVLKEQNLWVPAELVFMPPKISKDSMNIREAISTGLAAGPTKIEALFSGIFECIERDASIIMWLKEISFPRIKNESIEEYEIQNTLKICYQLGLNVQIFDVTNNIPVPTYLVLIKNEKHVPHISIGTNCDTNQIKALKGAIEEALGCYHFYGIKCSDGKLSAPNFNDLSEINSIQDHPIYYALGYGSENLEFLENGKVKDFNPNEYEELSKEDLILYMKNLGLSIYSIDLTTKDVKNTGIHVVKTVIPELANLDCKFPLLKCARLNSVPASMNYSYNSDNFNLSPHPFP